MQFDAPVKLWIVRERAQSITAVFGYRDTMTARTMPAASPPEKPSALGLHFKTPFVQSVNSLDKRFLEWEGAPVAIPTRDKTYIHVVTFARWRIEDPKTYI